MKEDVNLDSVFAKESVAISEHDRLELARQVLFGLGFISLLVFVGCALLPESRALETILELVKIGVLPLATLVISFYFSERRVT